MKSEEIYLHLKALLSINSTLGNFVNHTNNFGIKIALEDMQRLNCIVQNYCQLKKIQYVECMDMAALKGENLYYF